MRKGVICGCQWACAAHRKARFELRFWGRVAECVSTTTTHARRDIGRQEPPQVRIGNPCRGRRCHPTTRTANSGVSMGGVSAPGVEA